MTGITGNFDKAVKESSRVLNVKGRVLPSTLAVVRLCAKLVDGREIEGESSIPEARGQIDRVFLDPPHAAPLEEVVTALRGADAIVLGRVRCTPRSCRTCWSIASAGDRSGERGEDLRLQRDDAARRDRRLTRPRRTCARCCVAPTRTCASRGVQRRAAAQAA